MTIQPALHRYLAAETLGTAFLLAAIAGSGIMEGRLSGGNVALALLANSLATGTALVAPILAFGAISGAHFNPAVSCVDASRGGLATREAIAYSAAQLMGAVAGVGAAAVAPCFRWLVPPPRDSCEVGEAVDAAVSASVITLLE